MWMAARVSVWKEIGEQIPWPDKKDFLRRLTIYTSTYPKVEGYAKNKI